MQEKANNSNMQSDDEGSMNDSRKKYVSPQLRNYGKVSDLTQTRQRGTRRDNPYPFTPSPTPWQP